MQRTINTKFFHFRQNNSGGYFITNDDVAPNLIVEAMNAKEAEQKMNDITSDYLQFCPCCGERWSSWIDDDDGTEEPTVWGKSLDECKDATIIHYIDGRKEKVNYKAEGDQYD
ncbi:hypothetical protein D1872_250850 [compost metagenome]